MWLVVATSTFISDKQSVIDISRASGPWALVSLIEKPTSPLKSRLLSSCGRLLILLYRSLIHEIMRHGMVTFLHYVNSHLVLCHVELQIRIVIQRLS